jgi:hypothetical protein
MKQTDKFEKIFHWMNELEPTTQVENIFRETMALTSAVSPLDSAVAFGYKHSK